MNVRELIDALEDAVLEGVSDDTEVMLMDPSSVLGFEPVESVVSTGIMMTEKVVIL